MIGRDVGPLQRFRGPGYFIAFLLIVFPPVDWVINVWPLEPATLSWRYAAEGLFSTTMLTMALGLLLVGLLASANADGRVLRVLALTGFVVTLALGALAVDFALNVVQLSGTAASGGGASFLLAGAKVFVKYAAAALGVAWTAVAAWRATRPGAPRMSATRSPRIFAGRAVRSDGPAAGG